MNTLAVISILALLTVTGAACTDQLWTGDRGTVQGRTELPIRSIFGGIAMLSMDQFLRLISVPAVIVAFLLASQISAAVHSDPEVAMVSQ